MPAPESGKLCITELFVECGHGTRICCPTSPRSGARMRRRLVTSFIGRPYSDKHHVYAQSRAARRGRRLTRPRPRARAAGCSTRGLIAVLGHRHQRRAGPVRPSLWFDEGATISASASRTLPELWRLLGHIDAVHGLYYLLMHGWFAIFPPTEFWSRFPSALAIGAAAAGVTVFTRQFAAARPSGDRGVRGRRVRHPAAHDLGGHRSTLVRLRGGRGHLADGVARRRGPAQQAAVVAVLRAGIDAVDLAEHQPGACWCRSTP